MTEYYREYVWRNGIPYGISKQEKLVGNGYKIPMDPYRKRISVELYEGDVFQKTIYDSALLDFRQLKTPADQTTWQKTVISASPEVVISHIRNQDDRLICSETCLFRSSLCVECKIASPQGFLLSVHRMFYQSQGDSFDGVILYDSNERQVMIKRYAIGAETNEFTDLLEENWEMTMQTR